MSEKSLAVAFEDTLAENTIDIISDIAEVGLDAVLDDGLLKDIPIISTAVSLFKIGKTIHDRVYVKQLGVFIDEIRKHTVTEEKRQKYINKIKENEAFRNKELEYLLTIIVRYVGYEKPRMLAKTYRAYLEERISWEELALFSEIIDRLLPGDYETLRSLKDSVSVLNGINGESILRLSAVGMVYEHENNSPYDVVGTGENQCLFMHKGSMERTVNHERIYKRTQSGNRFVEIIEGE
jgi:hypothetical protein